MGNILNPLTDIKTVDQTVSGWAHDVKTLPESFKSDYDWVVNAGKGVGELAKHPFTTKGEKVEPDPTGKTTPTKKKKDAAAKAEGKKQEDWQSNYNQDIYALLKPYQQAVGQLPKEFEGYLNNIENSPSSTIPHADEIINQLAAPYGGITGTGTSTLAATEQKALTNAEGGTKTTTNALKELAGGMGLYMKDVPYESIQKALIGRIGYETEYGTRSPLGKSVAWPESLQALYNEAVGGATSAGGSTNLKVPGLGSVKKTPKNTPTKHTGTATGAGTTHSSTPG